ncbi:MAG: L,D-transpeptidase family protein [Gammaproteobacteria bacterium]|nr:L,D-transpeptidase family protein [Gammaproteobacteria bacterium]
MISRRTIFFFTAVWFAAPAQGQVASEIALPASVLQKILMQTAVTHCTDMASLHSTSMEAALTELYIRRNYAPLWQEDTARLPSLQNELRQLSDDGLWLVDYEYALQATQMPDMCQELRLSSYYLMALEHLSRGRLPQQLREPQWQADAHAREELVEDASAELVELALAGDTSITNAFSQARPSLNLYRDLRQSYARLDKHAQPPMGIATGLTIRAGAQDTRLAQNFQRLLSDGYLPADSRLPTHYDAALQQAVRRFQSDHGLEPDGIVGAHTLTAFNMPPAQRLLQVRINLERLRWLNAQRDDYLLLVNIAGASVRLYRGEEIIWESRVQTGRPSRPTPTLVSSIDRITLNPSWTMPPTIVREDALPQIRRNPNYLQEKNLQVLDLQGMPIDPTQLDWSNPTGVMLRQPPGPTNPLGQVVFRLDNPFAIFLHDTPSQDQFAKSSRSVSSGCVRVENAAQLADLLLTSASPEQRALLLSLQESDETREVRVPGGPQLIIGYWTAEAGADGRSVLMQDPYDLDQALMNTFARFERPSAAMQRAELSNAQQIGDENATQAYLHSDLNSNSDAQTCSSL